MLISNIIIMKKYRKLEPHETFSNQYVKMQLINEIMIKLQTIILLVIIIMELIVETIFHDIHMFSTSIISKME
jgi:hypothetical protein